MPSVLLTAFEPYDRWSSNASWLALVELTQELPKSPVITTRLYPVDFAAVKQRLTKDLTANYDYAIHLGQAPGSSRVQLEAIGLNIGGSSHQSPDEFLPLSDDGPIGYRSPLPLAAWAVKLREAGIPAQVSYHAGTYLCNATLYWTCYLAERLSIKTEAAFIHLPLDVSQVVAEPHGMPSLPTALATKALRLILEQLD
ncbi:MAG TPA: pyroglutamyl-peptidase I [Pirellulales bacterium]|nr:pyroglutamyl-peptidase I [Pirellulales bacterium]